MLAPLLWSLLALSGSVSRPVQADASTTALLLAPFQARQAPRCWDRWGWCRSATIPGDVCPCVRSICTDGAQVWRTFSGPICSAPGLPPAR